MSNYDRFFNNNPIITAEELIQEYKFHKMFFKKQLDILAEKNYEFNIFQTKNINKNNSKLTKYKETKGIKYARIIKNPWTQS